MHDGHRERLRERYLENGFESLAEHEQLELLLTYALPRQDTNALAHALIKRYGSLSGVLCADALDLCKVSGLGERSALLLRLVGDFQRTTGERRVGLSLGTPDAAGSYCRSLFHNGMGEQLYLVSLDKNKRVLHADLITRGTPNRTAVYPRIAVECALRHNACGAILTHNHPSGDIRPSREDLEATNAVRSALEAIEIPLYDHIIVGTEQEYSFSLAGSIPKAGADPNEQQEAF